MAYNSAGRGSRGEMISHFTGVRLRINGTGSFQMRMVGLDEASYEDLLPLTLSSTPGREPFRGCNFVGQRAMFRGGTTEIHELFEINRIVIFAAELWSEYPNTD